MGGTLPFGRVKAQPWGVFPDDTGVGGFCVFAAVGALGDCVALATGAAEGF